MTPGEPGVAPLFAGRHVSVVLDCDRAGREAVARIAADLPAASVRGGIVDLARARTDGYDLTEWLAERPNWVRRSCAGRSGRLTPGRAPTCRRLAGDGRRLCGELAPVRCPQTAARLNARCP